MKEPKKPNKKRKKKYIPNIAAVDFKPNNNWTLDEASRIYSTAKFPFNVDRIFYEDCIKGMKKLPSNSIDLIIADPPFGLNFSGKESNYNRNASFVIKGYREINNNYEEFSLKWISEIPRIMKKSSAAWIFSGWTNLVDILNAIRKVGLTLVNDIIWKYQFGVFTERKFVTSHYHILFVVKGPDYYFNKILHYPLDVWEINRGYQPGKQKNGTKLPEQVVKKCIDFTSKPGDLVLDPFIGNGTTAVVSKGNYRHYIGFEINNHIKVIIDSNINSVNLGEFYLPYDKIIDENVERAKRLLLKKK